MIMGIGTDIVSVARFSSWETWSSKKLASVFGERELQLCLTDGPCERYLKQKLASRFAAKEAFFKSLSSLLVQLDATEQSFALLFVARHVQVLSGPWGVPYLHVAWAAFEKKLKRALPPIDVQLSLSHEREYAVAFVVCRVQTFKERE